MLAAVILLLLPIRGAESFDSSQTSTLEPGAGLRIVAPTLSQDWIQGTLRFADTDRLVLDMNSGKTFDVQRDAVKRLEIHNGRRRNTVKGFVLGSLAGLFVLPVPGIPTERRSTTRVFAVCGALGGALIGALIKTDRWVALDTPDPRKEIPAHALPSN
jgi:hypothetical protein